MTDSMLDLPIVDLSAFPDDAALAQAIEAAMERTGLVCLTNTGFDDQLITDLWDSARLFFSLPSDVKSQYRIEYPPVDGSSGYTEFRRTRNIGETEDCNEKILEKDHEAFNYYPFLNSLIWPDNKIAPGFITKYQAFCDGCLELSMKILNSFSLFWEKDPDLVRSVFCSGLMKQSNRVNASGGRLNYYGSLNGDEKESSQRLISHKDYDMFTLLWSQGPGLQVQQNGEWKDVPVPPPGGLLLQGGFALEIITNNRIPATFHRVMVPPGATELERRTSSVYFFNPDNQCPIVPLDDDPTGADTWEEIEQKQFGKF